MTVEFNNMSLIGNFDKNNFSGTRGQKTPPWEPRLGEQKQNSSWNLLKAKQCKEAAAGGEIDLKRSHFAFCFCF